MRPTSFFQSTSLTRFRCSLGVGPCLTAALLLTAASTPALAQLEDESAQDGPQTEATLIAESKAIRPGQPFTVAVRLKLEKDWHVYWRNPGDSGTPTRISWSLPAGFRAGAIQWPTPQRFVSAPLVSYGYENEVWLLTQITPPTNLTLGQAVTLGADVDWLVCSEQCVPQKKSLGLRLGVSKDTPQPDESHRAQFATARSRLPVTASQAGLFVRAEPVVASNTKARTAVNLRFSPAAKMLLPAEQLKQLYFYPADESTLTHAPVQELVKEGYSYRVPLAASEYATAPLKRLRGVLVAPLGNTKGSTALSRGMWIDVPVASTNTNQKRTK